MDSEFLTLFFLTAITMIAFAANSILGRVALEGGEQAYIDPASYTAIRLIAGALMLALLAGLTNREQGNSPSGGNWFSAAGLFGYAAFFSFSYVAIETGIGALILFACVQGTMIGWGLIKGDRPNRFEWLGLVIAFGAFGWLVSPGLEAPDPLAALLMAISGICWGFYSLRGKTAQNPLAATTNNFIRSVPMAALLLLVFALGLKVSVPGMLLAITSGAITSGLGYALWYHVLTGLTGTQAAIVQLTVPVLAGIGGTLALGEPWTGRFIIASILILGGVGLAILSKNLKPKV